MEQIQKLTSDDPTHQNISSTRSDDGPDQQTNSLRLYLWLDSISIYTFSDYPLEFEEHGKWSNCSTQVLVYSSSTSHSKSGFKCRIVDVALFLPTKWRCIVSLFPPCISTMLQLFPPTKMTLHCFHKRSLLHTIFRRIHRGLLYRLLSLSLLPRLSFLARVTFGEPGVV